MILIFIQNLFLQIEKPGTESHAVTELESNYKTQHSELTCSIQFYVSKLRDELSLPVSYR